MAARKGSSTIVGVEGRVRDEAVNAAERAGMPVGEWVERAVRKALEEGLEPAPPAGVEFGELEAMVRRVVAEELQPVKDALARPGGTVAQPSSDGGSPVSLMRERRRQRRR